MTKKSRRPADVIGNAVHVMRIATGEIKDTGRLAPESEAAQLGRKGGQARAKAMTPAQRREIAKRAAAKRWGKP